jgi:3-isopropylmalate/(R)-2-methylmalate dehydratase large subunit
VLRVWAGGKFKETMTHAGPSVSFGGRILFLTEDASLLEAQLAGKDLDPATGASAALLGSISTDEITPGWVCYYYDETLGRYCLVGLRGGKVATDAIRAGGFSVVVSGPSKGCGSSRETAPYSEIAAGVKLVIARSIEKIYRQNAQNIGLLTSTDLGLVARIARGEAIPIAEFTSGLDPISAAIVEQGGLFAYNKARLAGSVSPPAITTPPRPMTLCEKILARHAVVDARSGAVGVTAVKPGDAFFARADVRFSHEYVTPMAESLLRLGFGPGATVTEPESVFAFRDHLTFLDLIMPKAHRDMGLDKQANKLAVVQDEFAKRSGIKLYGEVQRDGRPAGSEGICHNKVIEEIALPGQLVVGTDSHTCMAGALGCFAFGVGSTDMANAWVTRDVRVTVPESARFVLRGKLGPHVCAKDLMLHVLSQPFFKTGQGIGKVLEFAGEGIASLSLDERATLTNMAVEAGGFTGIIEADETVVAYLVEARGLAADDVRGRILRADEGASYCATFEIDLAAVVPMVATPGDPRNGVPLDQLGPDVKIDIAYGGSCTGGKKADMDMYASVLADALARGERVAPGVHLYLQFGSQDVRRYAEEKGYLDVFERVGAELVDPSCGACIKAGPGSSDSPNQVTVSAQNRNFPGRSGPGKVYLASPYVVAASAVAGKIVLPPDETAR